MPSSWTEYLCLGVESDAVHLSSRGYELLAEVKRFTVETEGGLTEYRLPDEIDGSTVVGIEDEWVVGGALVPHDDNAELTVTHEATHDAACAEVHDWLTTRGWKNVRGFDAVWPQIEAALAMLKRADGASDFDEPA
jgi:hypothetical protein